MIALGPNVGHVQAKTVNQVVPFTQPDGRIFGAHVFGDELAINWVSVDGYAFVDNPADGFLYYAELDSKGEYRASRCNGRGAGLRPVADQHGLLLPQVRM